MEGGSVKMETQKRRLERNNGIWLIANIVLCAIALAAVAFADVWQMQDILSAAAPLALFAMAMALPYSLGYFDVSQAGVGALSGALLAFWITGSGMPEAAAILLSLLISAAVGALNGLLAVFVCRGRVLLTLVGSFALGALGICVAFWMTSGSQIYLYPFESEFLRMLGDAPLTGVLLLAIALLVAVSFAASARRKASSAKVIAAYLLSALLSTLAALVLIGRMGAYTLTLFDSYSVNSILCLAIAGAGIAFLRGRRGNVRILAFVRVLLAVLILVGMNYLMLLSGINYMMQAALQAALLLICVALNALAGAAQADTAPAQEDESEEDAAAGCGAAIIPADGAPYSENAPARGGWNEPSAQQYDPPRFNTTPPSSSRPSTQATQPSENRQDSQPAYDSQPAKAEPTPASQPVPDEEGGFAALEKLADLHKQGILTDEEFQKKKNDILDRL